MGLARAGIAFTAWLLVNPVVHVGLHLLCVSSARLEAALEMESQPVKTSCLLGVEEAGNASWGFPEVKYLPSCLVTIFFLIQTRL